MVGHAAKLNDLFICIGADPAVAWLGGSLFVPASRFCTWRRPRCECMRCRPLVVARQLYRGDYDAQGPIQAGCTALHGWAVTRRPLPLSGYGYLFRQPPMEQQLSGTARPPVPAATEVTFKQGEHDGIAKLRTYGVVRTLMVVRKGRCPGGPRIAHLVKAAGARLKGKLVFYTSYIVCSTFCNKGFE